MRNQLKWTSYFFQEAKWSLILSSSGHHLGPTSNFRPCVSHYVDSTYQPPRGLQSIRFQVYSPSSLCSQCLLCPVPGFRFINLDIPANIRQHSSPSKKRRKKVSIAVWQLESSSCANSTVSLNSLSPSVSVGHRSGQAFYAASGVHTELVFVSFCWLANSGVSMCRSPPEYIAYQFVLPLLILVWFGLVL